MSKHFFCFCAALAMTLSAAVAQSPARAARNISFPEPTVTLGGVMTTNSAWGESLDDAGVYTIEARKGGKITLQHRNPMMAFIVAGIVHNGSLYAVECTPDGLFYRTYSTSTWNSSASKQEIDVVNLPSDLTYDPVTGKVYGGFWDEDYQGYSRFASFGLTTAEASDIKDPRRDERDIFAIAADGKGTIYTLFGSFDYLATFDPKIGSAERIGKTGISPVANAFEGYGNSMVYDATNDRLLATVYEESGYGENKVRNSALYSINPATGAAEKLMAFDGVVCFSSLYIVSDAPTPTAPAAPTGLRTNAAGTTGSIEFDAPASGIGGAPLSGELLALVRLNGEERIVDGITPGQHVVIPDVSFANGTNTLKITMGTAEERGDFAEIEFWAGEDTPSPVSDLMLVTGDGTARLSWTAPAVGANGGALIAENLRYKVVRFPDNTVVATDLASTSYVDNTLDLTKKSIWYEVTASNSQGSSTAVASNRMPAAGALIVPFSETFDTADDFAVWTVLDCNGSVTWIYDSSAKSVIYRFPQDNTPGDDYLISPAIRLEAGRTYKLGYDYRAYSKTYPESMEVLLGTVPTPEGLSTRLASHIRFTHTKAETAEVSFRAETDGVYYIAFHCISDPMMWSIYVDNVNIDVLDGGVPAVVADAKATPAPQGELKATVSFTTPSADTEGKAISTLTKAVVRRTDTGAIVATVDNIAPGQAVEVVDATITASGTYTWSVVCHNALGGSVAALCSTFVGVDAPGQVQNLTVGEVDRHPVLRWQVPAAGANGGWYNPEGITYRIVRSDGNVIAEACTDLTFTDTGYTTPAKSQDALWYLVTPYSGTVKGAYCQSALTLFGVPYATPATETFAGADMAFYPWITQSWDMPQYAWTLDNMGYNPSAPDQNGDNGLATFHSVGEKAGTESWYYSPMFDISALEAPVVSFWLYHSPSIEGDGSIEIYAGEGTDFESLGTVIRRDAAEADGWLRHTVDLAAWKGNSRLRIAFKGIADAVADIYLDNITIESSLATDAAITSFTAPVRIAKGVEGDYAVAVLNAGSRDLSNIAVKIASGSDVLFSTTVASLAAGEQAVVSAAIVLPRTGTKDLTAAIELAGDMKADNNSASASVLVVEPLIPVPLQLSVADSDAGASLVWLSPEKQGSVLDDVEKYTDFAIDGIGEWSMHDGDYAYTFYINNNVDYPNASDRKAFQVLNVEKLGIDIWEQGKAHSGKKIFAAMAANGYVNNDWLISPRLNGAEQWISFWARSFTVSTDIKPERMRVFYSTTDANPVNFTEITTNYIELDGTWRQFTYFMPEGARHFAVNCVSDDSFAMFVDDLCFNDLSVPAWKLTGYEVWRDGVKIDDTTETSYIDADAPAKATYTVRAVYGTNAVSADSNAADYTASSLATPSAAAEIEAVFTPSGIALDPATPLAPGIYIIRYTDGTTSKITR